MKTKYCAATILAAKRGLDSQLTCREAFMKVHDAMGFTEKCNCVFFYYSKDGASFYLADLSHLDATLVRDKGDGRLEVLNHNDAAISVSVGDVIVILDRVADQILLAGICKENYMFEDFADITVFL